MLDTFPYVNYNDLNLDWILSHIKTLEQWKVDSAESIDKLTEIYKQISAGNFPDEIKKAFENWMQANAINLVGSLVKQVYFGLTIDGHFVAYIPDGWDDITFNTTGLDIELAIQPTYGHLVLSY